MKQQQSELKIRITQLSEGTHHYRFTTHPLQLSLGDDFQETIEIDAVLEKTARQIYLTTRVSAKSGYSCDRCAESSLQEIDASYAICYALDESPSDAVAVDDLRLIHPGTPFIELTEDIRQVILLAIPMKRLCREDCKGLCPHCGVNMNNETCNCTEESNDSHWDVLRKLITENNN